MSTTPNNNIVSNETLNERNSYEPRNIFVRNDGQIILPSGSILNALRATILFNGTLLDNAPNGNLIQGTTTNGNSVDATSNSLLLVSTSSGFTRGYRSAILASNLSTINGGDINGMYNSWNSNISSNGDPNDNTSINTIIGCNACDIQGGVIRGFIANSQLCNITSPTWVSSNQERIMYSSIISSNDCNITRTGTTTLNDDNCIVASRNSDITDSRRCMLFGSNSPSNINACEDVVGMGPACIATGVTKNFLVESTAVTDNEMRVGLDFHVDNNNIVADDGYIQSNQSFLDNYKEITSLTYTVTLNDHTIFINNTNSVTVTLPDPATLGATLPLNTTRDFHFIGVLTGTPSVITLATGTFNNKAGWTTHALAHTGGRITVRLINSSTPYWEIPQPVQYAAFVYTDIANNFGLTPPQSDAAQLPTSTDRASHEALTTTSYYTFDGITTNSSIAFTLTNPGVQINNPGVYKFTYQIDVRCNGGLGSYILRSDLVDTGTGLPVPGSYTESGGQNSTAGSRHINVSALTGAIAPSSYQLRVSQDSGANFLSNGDLERVSIFIETLI